MNDKKGILKILKHQSKSSNLYWIPLIDGYFLQSLYPRLNQTFAFVTLPLDFDSGPGSEEDFHNSYYDRLIKTYRKIGAQPWIRGIIPIKATLTKSDFEWISDQEKRFQHRRFRIFGETLTEKWLVSSHTSYRTEYLIKNDHDYEIFGELVQEEQYYPKYEGFNILNNKIGTEGLVVVSGLDTPLVRLFRSCNTEKLIIDLMTKPSLIREVMDLIHKKNLEGYKLIAQSPAEVVVLGCSYLTTKLISPKIFEEFVIDYCRDYADILHDKNKVFLIHMCGDIKNLLPLIPQTKVDGIECLTPPPTGDTEALEALDELGEGFCIIGGLDPNLVTNNSNPLEIKKEVKSLLNSLNGRYNFILGSGDAIPYNTPLDNLYTVSKTIKDFA